MALFCKLAGTHPGSAFGLSIGKALTRRGRKRFLRRQRDFTHSGLYRLIGSPSEAPWSWGNLWKCLLVTASMLSCSIQPTSAQFAPITVVPNPPYGTVGSNITLTIQGFSQKALSYNWFRKKVETSNKIAVYSVSSGEQIPADIRQKVFTNGSLLIPNLTFNDTDDYIVQIVEPGGMIAVIRESHVGVYEKLAKPNITVNNTNITENDTLVMMCSTKSEGVKIKWFSNDKLLSPHEMMNLSNNNQTLTIMSVKREDRGSYQCEMWNPISANRSDALTLTVNYGPDNIKIFPSHESEEFEVQFSESLTLKCEAQSYPPAQYEWHINDTSGPIFSGNITHESCGKSGKYTCWARNNVTKLSISKTITVKVVADHNPSAGTKVGIVIGVLAGEVLTGALIYVLFCRKTGRASEHHLTHHESSAPIHSQAHSNSSPNRDEDVSYSTVNVNAQKTPAMAQPRPQIETIYSELK